MFIIYKIIIKQMKKSKTNAGPGKLKIKPVRYTLAEQRKINYLTRNGLPIPDELKNKPYEDLPIHSPSKTKTANDAQKLNLQNMSDDDSIEEENKKNSNTLMLNDNKGNKQNEQKSLIKLGVASKPEK